MKRLLVVGLLSLLALPAAAQRAPFQEELQPTTLTMAFAGDILIHSSVWRSAERFGRPYNFRPMFTPTRKLIAGADLAICHLETPVSPTSTGLSGFPRFNAPREILDGLVYAGFDGCSTASNHSNDQGPEGIDRTLSAMERVGLVHSGTRSSPDDSMIGFYETNGVLVANISATYGLNGLDLSASQAYRVQMLNESQILARATEARDRGADLVVVSVHCCAEFRTMPTDAQLALTHRLINSDDIDLIVTHHSHVVGPIEWVNDKPIIHGLGNFLSNQSARAALPAHSQDGVIAIVTARRDEDGWRFDQVSVVPTYVDEPEQGHVIRIASPGSTPYTRTMNAIGLMGFDVPIYQPPPLPRLVASRLN